MNAKEISLQDLAAKFVVDMLLDFLRLTSAVLLRSRAENDTVHGYMKTEGKAEFDAGWKNLQQCGGNLYGKCSEEEVGQLNIHSPTSTLQGMCMLSERTCTRALPWNLSRSLKFLALVSLLFADLEVRKCCIDQRE